MIHRHLNHQQFTLPAIDDIIARGRPPDWEALREALLADPSLADKIKQFASLTCTTSTPSVITFGTTMSNTSKSELPDWEEVLSSAARLQTILPQAVLVGGTASALYAQHRRSHDADHVLPPEIPLR